MLNGIVKPPPTPQSSRGGDLVGKSWLRLPPIQARNDDTQRDPCFKARKCGGALSPPVSGRFGIYFDKTKKNDLDKKKRRKLAGKGIITPKPRKSKMQLQIENLQRQFPPAPPPYMGPHNLMWDPRVRRGGSIVHFTELEKDCILPKKRRPRNPNKRNPIIASKGVVTYPEIVRVRDPYAVVDLSQFLEEQDAVIPQTKDKCTELDEIILNQDEKEQIWHTHAFYIDSAAALKKEREFQQYFMPERNFRIGLNVETQVDNFHLCKEMHLLPNPTQDTVIRTSKVLSTQIHAQSLREEMEKEELDLIRGQCEVLENWMAKENLRKTRERHELDLKMARMKQEMEDEEEWDRRIHDLSEMVDLSLTIRCGMTKTFENGFTSLTNDGFLGRKDGEEAVKDWLNQITTKSKLKRDDISNLLLDEIIDDTNNDRLNCLIFGCYAIPSEPESVEMLLGPEDDEEQRTFDIEEEAEKADENFFQKEEKKEEEKDKKNRKSPPIINILPPRFVGDQESMTKVT